MAKRTGLTQNAIVRIWRAFGLQPHRVENFKFSKDPQFVEKVRDIVGLYLNPPDRAIVLCVDEKSQVQALNRTQPILPLAPRRTGAAIPRLRAARSHVVVRCHGCGYRSHHQHLLPTAPASGVPAIPQRDRRESSARLRGAPGDGQLRHAQGSKVRGWLARHPRYHVHFTPTSGSWLNLVERLFGEVTERCVRRGSHTAVRALEKAMLDYLDQRNRESQAVRVDRGRGSDSWARSSDFVNVSLTQDTSVCYRARSERLPGRIFHPPKIVSCRTHYPVIPSPGTPYGR